MIPLKRHPLYLLDTWSHKLHLPRLLQDPICDWFDWWLGMEDDVIEEWWSRQEYIWRVFREHIVSAGTELIAISGKPVEGEPFFIVTFSDGHRMKVTVTDDTSVHDG